MRFNAALASAGLLEYRPGIGFEAAVAHGSGPRGRYSLAHEIGHTFFVARVLDVPSEALGLPEGTLFDTQSSILEELFCETFAGELLLPTPAAESELQNLSQIGGPNEFLSVLEQVSSRFSVSLRMLLIRAYSVGVWPGALLVAVLDAGWLRRKQCEDAIEVVAAYSNRQSRWYMPNKQFAQDAGFLTAISLTRAWDALSRRAEETADSAGAFQFDEGGGFRKLDQKARSGPLVPEDVFLKRKEDNGQWSRRTVKLPILYRLYASSASDAYILAVAQLLTSHRQQGVPSAHTATASSDRP